MAYTVLLLGSVNDQNGLFHPASFEAQPNGPRYPQERATQATVALGEALAWLTVNILVMPAPGLNGNNGDLMITRRGREALQRQAFDQYRQAAAFPKTLLHPLIADQVWLNLARGDYATAVFLAFRAVEEAVREAGGFRPEDIGSATAVKRRVTFVEFSSFNELVILV